MDIVVIRNYSRQSVWIVPVLMASALAGLYLLHRGQYPLIAWPLVAIFILGMFSLLISPGNDEDNRLVINDDGILDRTLGVGIIPWSDVLDATIESRYNNHFICLKLSRPDYYLNKLPERKRQRVQVSYELGFTRFNIDVSGAESEIIKIRDIIKKLSADRRSQRA